MTDIYLVSIIQDLLAASGYVTSSISTDEDGYSHTIKFQHSSNKGIVYTAGGRVIMIEAEQGEAF